MSQANVGYLYYKDYFRQLEFKADLILLETSGKNQALFDYKLPSNADYQYHAFLEPPYSNFSLFTTYPGLLIGSGYNHEIGGIDDELKLGFFFDHTTGLPVIMGSSVKGLLRSVFPNLEKDESLKTLKTQWLEVLISHIQDDKFFENTYQPDSEKGSLKDIDICQLENEIFEGKDSQGDYLSLYKRDIFHDAIIISKDRKFLDSDFITHHEHPLKNPNPIQFLKILPNIKFQFNFDLKEGLLTVEQKLRLFQKIFLTIGIGAKTNVGYGQFIEAPDIPKQTHQTNAPRIDYTRSTEATRQMKRDSTWDGVIDSFHRENTILKVNIGDEAIYLKKKTERIKGGQPEIGSKIRIKMLQGATETSEAFEATIL